MLNDVFGLIYTGEQNIKLVELTSMRAVGALPVGGRYRVIDFVLSNMVNSGMRNVGVIAQKNYHSLVDHLGSGKNWDLSRKRDGLFILPPFDTVENQGSYRGVCDAVKNSVNYIRRTAQQYCLLTGAHTIYNTTYNDMYKMHRETNADVTVMYSENTRPQDYENSFQDVRLFLNDKSRVVDIEYNSTMPASSKMGMDIYLIRKDLLEYLVEDAVSRGRYNWVTDVLIPNIDRLKIYACRYDGYVGRLHSISSYFELNKDILNIEVQRDLFKQQSKIYTRIKDEVPAKYGKDAAVKNSLIANGCIIEGDVQNSVLFRGVYVAKGAMIKDCVIMQDTAVFKDSYLENVVLDKIVQVRSGRRLIGAPNYPIIIRKGVVI